VEKMITIQPREKINKVGEFYHEVFNISEAYKRYWLEHTLFHWDFWINVLFSIVPIVVWIKVRKRESSNRLLFSGMFVLIVSSYLDLLGVQEGKWYYTGKVIPYLPSFLPWDWSILPVFTMLLIQSKPKMPSILKGLIFGGIGAFIGEPFFKWLGFYVETDWNTFYSFPIYFAIYLIAHRLSKAKNFDPID
jgi:hypothetical protein